ncbi:MAG: hypothetical protein EU532_11130 [Promethearchaeota archaeon]|nr:MAG: hypothetical protein EU532_11130 [Candidatus Lokiarchaeota archaeon]
MEDVRNDDDIMQTIRKMTSEGKIDAVVEKIADYLNQSNEENYIERLENVLETVSTLMGGRTVIRFLIENSIIDIPTLLENLSKKDSLLRYSFLLLLKDMCENEEDLFLPHSEELLTSEDPNVREAFLQLLIFIAGGEREIEDEILIELIASRLVDDKDFVIEKAVQTLKTIGKKNPSLITKTLKKYTKECSENEELKKNVDEILKSIVTVEKIEEIVEEEESKTEPVAQELVEKEKKLEYKEIELNEKEKKLEDKEAELEVKEILSSFDLTQIEKEKQLKEKEIELEEKEIELKEKEMKLDLKGKAEKVELPKKLVKEEKEILDKEIELKKKDLEIKKKKLELEEKQKDLEAIEIIEKQKTLKIKEELIQKERDLEEVEIELKKKSIEEKERKIMEDEAKRIREKIRELEKKKKL